MGTRTQMFESNNCEPPGAKNVRTDPPRDHFLHFRFAIVRFEHLGSGSKRGAVWTDGGYETHDLIPRAAVFRTPGSQLSKFERLGLNGGGSNRRGAKNVRTDPPTRPFFALSVRNCSIRTFGFGYKAGGGLDRRRFRNARFNPPRGRSSHPRFTIVQIRTFGFERGRFEPPGVQKTFALTPHATIFCTFGSQLFGSNIWARVQNGGRFGPTAVKKRTI